MGEEDKSAPEMKDLTSTSFGYLIGFVLPGIFGIYALSYWFPQLAVLLQPIFKAEATVGPSAIFLLIAVGMGLCVSGARYFLFEGWFYKGHRLCKELFQGLTADKLALLRAFAEEHYRYHQFYGGCAVAVLILFTGWLREHWKFDWQLAYVGIGCALFILLLERSASDCFFKYVDKCNKLVEEGEAAK